MAKDSFRAAAASVLGGDMLLGSKLHYPRFFRSPQGIAVNGFQLPKGWRHLSGESSLKP
jgi:hypothetical protein